MIIQKLPKIEGRTFVCGDIHGAYERVQQFLDFIKFDKNTDRLISVGDMVDRGPDNEKCLALLEEPWFFAVKGNHEDLMLNFYNQRPGGEWWVPNGGAWGLNHIAQVGYGGDLMIINQQVAKHVMLASKLPLMITVEQNDGSFFHVIHAEFGGSSKKLVTNEHLHDEQKFLEIASGKTYDGGANILWKRSVFYPFYNTCLDDELRQQIKEGQEAGRYKTIFADDLDIVYSGHTIVRKPLKFHRQINLDTCAFGSFPIGPKGIDLNTIDPAFITYPPEWTGLTVTEPATGQYWIAKHDGVHEQELFEIHMYEDNVSSSSPRKIDDNF